MVDVMHDNNGYAAWTGLSSSDGVTPIRIKINASTGGMLIDTTTAIAFTPRACSKNDGNMIPTRTGVSTSNSNIIVPLFVNPATGAVLVDMI